MATKRSDRPRVESSGGRRYIHIASRRAEALHSYLRARGIQSDPPSPCSKDVDSIRLYPNVDVKAVQAILDQWS